MQMLLQLGARLVQSHQSSRLCPAKSQKATMTIELDGGAGRNDKRTTRALRERFLREREGEREGEQAEPEQA